MKSFANNTFWRRAAMTLLLAVITITTAFAAITRVVFYPNGGAILKGLCYQIFNDDTPQPLMLNEFTREGYDFDGWNTEKDGTGTSYAVQLLRASSTLPPRRLSVRVWRSLCSTIATT